jgi:hypothetical protein
MARISRSPGAFMAAYVILFLLVGPWLALSGPASRNFPQIVIAVFLAWRVTQGDAFGRAAWVLLIVYSIFGCFIAIAGTGRSAGTAAALGLLAGYVAQLALLVSAPVYERASSDWPAAATGAGPARVPASAPPWPIPRLRTILASLGAGLVITLIPISGMKALPSCPPTNHGPVPARLSCQARGAGYPGAYRFSGPVYTSGDPQPLFVVVRHHFYPEALAADWADWSLVTFSLLYLAWLSSRREDPEEDPASDVRVPSDTGGAGGPRVAQGW